MPSVVSLSTALLSILLLPVHFSRVCRGLKMPTEFPASSIDRKASHHNAQMATPRSGSPHEAALDFARLVGRLKTTPRTGWVRRGVPRYESVADHSWRVATLSLLLQGGSLDAVRCTCMGLVHDLAEALIGDITPYDSVSKVEKKSLEHEAIDRIANMLELATSTAKRSESAREYLIDLLSEYEARETDEAKAVKDLDLLDMVIQADEYEQVFGVDLTDFFDNTPAERFQDGVVRGVAEELHRQRTERIQASCMESRLGSAMTQLSNIDTAFVEEYAKASTLNRRDIEAIMTALRQWESRCHV